ncbi:MAG: hypothetical protein Solumvirus4_21 [Solumvirus sp.]|uniref:Uncharacterized protein n=1 Tax=Solumvirus sp. TaxID=2487773 RepID=A0A3G5AJT7_9VIRU|nr:MAG: hypothetical protein Solumvirus4_21 [Solumvirus sp.]
MSRRKFEKYPNQYLIETGTYLGEAIQDALDAGFEKVISIELAEKLADGAKKKYEDYKNVEIHQGSSASGLFKIIEPIKKPITFWLDAHYSGGVTTHDPKLINPILEELKQIAKHPIKTHTILVDDVRLFLNNDNKGLDGVFDVSIEQVKEEILKINPEYKFTLEDGHVPKDILVAQLPQKFSELKLVEESPVTLVTGFFQSKTKKYTQDEYFKYIDYFVQLKCNMIIFSDTLSYDKIKSLRSPHNTRVYLHNIEDFYVNKYNDFWTWCKTVDTEQYHSKDLYMIWAERHTHLMKEAAKCNPFKSEYFIWVDIGAIRNDYILGIAQNTFPNINKITKLIPKDKIMICAPWPIEKSYYGMSEMKGIDTKIDNPNKISTRLLNMTNGKDDPKSVIVQGGCFGAHISQIGEWSKLYEQHLNLFIQNNVYGGKDQAIMGNSYLNSPEKFVLITGEWSKSKDQVQRENEWFHFFETFS